MTTTTHALPHRRTRAVAVALLAGTMMAGACSSDDTTGPGPAQDSAAGAVSTTTAAAPSDSAVASDEPTGEQAAGDPAPEFEAFCAVAAEVNAGTPTTELVRAYVEAAPVDIAEPAQKILEIFEANDDDLQAVFSDPEALAAIDELTAFESQVCGTEPPVDPDLNTIDPAATRVNVVATDYHFEMDLPTSAGRYSFVMENQGAEPHLMILLQLEEGATVADVLASEGDEGMIASFESPVSPPGGEAVITVDLAPGQWVIVCPIPNASGESHASLGMIHEFEIT